MVPTANGCPLGCVNIGCKSWASAGKSAARNRPAHREPLAELTRHDADGDDRVNRCRSERRRRELLSAEAAMSKTARNYKDAIAESVPARLFMFDQRQAIVRQIAVPALQCLSQVTLVETVSNTSATAISRATVSGRQSWICGGRRIAVKRTPAARFRRAQCYRSINRPKTVALMNFWRILARRHTASCLPLAVPPPESPSRRNPCAHKPA